MANFAAVIGVKGGFQCVSEARRGQIIGGGWVGLAAYYPFFLRLFLRFPEKWLKFHGIPWLNLRHLSPLHRCFGAVF